MYKRVNKERRLHGKNIQNIMLLIPPDEEWVIFWTWKTKYISFHSTLNTNSI